MQRNPAIECHESTVVPHGKAEEVRVRNLPRTVNSCCVEMCGIQEAQFIGPELVDMLCASLTQASHERLNRLRIRI